MKNNSNLDNFERNLSDAINQYGTDFIDICHDDEIGEYIIAYHSDNNSFKISGIEEDEISSNNDLARNVFKDLANKYHCGYCL